MTARRPRSEIVAWYGVVGAPMAWVVFQVVGIGATEAACSVVGAPGSLDAWTLTSTVVAAAVALGAEVAAIATFRATQDAGDEPPAARVHFLSVVGMTIGVLFVALILMGGVGTLVLPECVQS